MRSNKKAVDRETHQAAKGLKAKRDREKEEKQTEERRKAQGEKEIQSEAD